MISTVSIQRMTMAEVAVEHPDEWDDAQLLAAVNARQIDVAERASMWSGDNHTTIEGVTRDHDCRACEEHGEVGCEECGGYAPEPVTLREDE